MSLFRLRPMSFTDLVVATLVGGAVLGGAVDGILALYDFVRVQRTAYVAASVAAETGSVRAAEVAAQVAGRELERMSTFVSISRGEARAATFATYSTLGPWGNWKLRAEWTLPVAKNENL